MTPRTAIVAAAALMLAPLALHAQPNKEQYTYRCTGKDGKKYYGQTIPPACFGQPLELINKQGMVVKRIDPEGEEKARVAKEAEAEKKRELEAAQKEAMRRNGESQHLENERRERHADEQLRDSDARP